MILDLKFIKNPVKKQKMTDIKKCKNSRKKIITICNTNINSSINRLVQFCPEREHVINV